MNVDELTLLRRLAVDEPADADAARAEVWRRLNGGEVQASDRRRAGRTRLLTRRVVAIAAMIGVDTLIGVCIPNMGMHAIPESDAAATTPFSAAIIVGYYDGKPIFIEPMITKAKLLERQSFDLVPTDFRRQRLDRATHR